MLLKSFFIPGTLEHLPHQQPTASGGKTSCFNLAAPKSVNLKSSRHTVKKNYSCMWWWVLTTLILVIILQYIHTSNHYLVCQKLIQYYMSIISMLKHLLPISWHSTWNTYIQLSCSHCIHNFLYYPQLWIKDKIFWWPPTILCKKSRVWEGI